MARDGNGGDRKAAGRPDGGRFDKKTGQGPDDDPVPPEPSLDGADGAHMGMADDDPEPGDAGRAAVYGYAESKGGHVVGPVGAETFGTLGLDAAAPERHGIDRADFEEGVADAISDMVADDVRDNLGGIADGAAMDGYGVGSEDPR